MQSEGAAQETGFNAGCPWGEALVRLRKGSELSYLHEMVGLDGGCVPALGLL